MKQPFPGFPGEFLLHDGESALVLRAEEGVYPLEAVYTALYGFLGRAYCYVDRSGTTLLINVRVKGQEATAEALRQLGGEILNELLVSSIRLRYTERNQAIIDGTTREAFTSALGPPSIDELLAAGDEEDPFDDPLGISAPADPVNRGRA